MYSIHDAAAGAYLPPFFMQNDLLAIRAFAALINDPGHLFSQEPKDFTLFCFAVFDVVEGTVMPEKMPRVVRAAVTLVNPRKQIEIPLEQINEK